MTGLATEIDLRGFEDAITAFGRIERLDTAEALDIATAIAKSSTHERLRETKTAPDGTPWAAWSPGYAATRGAHHSLLMNEGNLDDSIASFHNASTGGVGSNLVYAAAMQFGPEDGDHPGRAFLGLSERDVDEIEETLGEWLMAKASGGQSS